jgi:hypothetical protein
METLLQQQRKLDEARAMYQREIYNARAESDARSARRHFDFVQ